MKPWELLADHLRTFDANTQVYETPTEQLDTPCYVVTPGDPWIDPQGTHPSFGHDEERYEVWAVAAASSAWDSTSLVHSMLHAVRHNLPDGWFFESVGQLAQFDHQGIPYLGAALRTTYNNCDSGESESES